MTKIAFIGIGNLGFPIALNLIKAGYDVTVYNRTPEKAKPLAEAGAKLASTPQEATQGKDVLITVLADDKALLGICTDAAIESLGAEGLHISMSTISPETSRKLSIQHQQFGVDYVAAPIFGRPEAMAARIGNIAISGPNQAKEDAKPLILAGAAKGIFDFGEDPGAANVVKLAGNFMISAAIEAMSEAYTMAEKNGVSRQDISEMFGQTLFACPIYQNYGKAIAVNKYDENVGFRLPLGLKDLNLVLDTALLGKTPMPFANIVQQRLISGLAKGREHWDWTGLAQGAADDAGL
ncbi:3-hydroxyisobutyrate dehydrogenase [Pseudarcicella hirudinis]|uniref:3-hydroxyisobutyrate dehydrogenase n=2 Tax=Pseudarcicella hirudinis TaxID=1079859 RepID=A0A1I5WZH8_9BACT|nr:3-hydroxyisobutyrate dehydrogenase [Pseudarcicella hirudinis]